MTPEKPFSLNADVSSMSDLENAPGFIKAILGWIFPAVNAVSYASLIWCIGLLCILRPAILVQAGLMSVWGILLGLFALYLFVKALLGAEFKRFEKLGVISIDYIVVPGVILFGLVDQLQAWTGPVRPLDYISFTVMGIYGFGALIRLLMTYAVLKMKEPDQEFIALLISRFQVQQASIIKFAAVFATATILMVVFQNFYHTNVSLFIMTFSLTTVIYKALLSFLIKDPTPQRLPLIPNIL